MEKYISQMLRESLMMENPSTLSPQEETIFNDLISETVNEAVDMNTLLTKFRSYAKRGAITVGIVVSLLSTNAIAQEQKKEILDIAKTELSQEEVSQIQSQLKNDTGLEFGSDYVNNNFTTVNDDKPFALPSEMEIKSLITKAGLPTQFIDNVYINYVKNAQGDDHAGVMISVRLKEESNFNRLAQESIKNKVYKLVVNALSVYKPGSEKGFSDKQGNQITLNLSVEDPHGNIIGGKPLQFNAI